MSFLSKMLGSKQKPRSKAAPADTDPTAAARAAMDALRGATQVASTTSARFPKPSEDIGARSRPTSTPPVTMDKPAPAESAPVNIWELDEEGADIEDTAFEEEVAPVAPTLRRRPARTKTRLLGFEAADTSVVSLFDGAGATDAELVAKQETVMFPTGWLVIKNGPGRGASFPLHQGMSVIGRGTDQTVSLDFGDMAISRNNHAAVAYDPMSHRFLIGHGGKSNLVRLNGRPLLSTEVMNDGDELQLGETTLVMKVLCTAKFNWSKSLSEGDSDDMAIA